MADRYHGKKGYLIVEGIGVIDNMHGWTLTTSRDKADASVQGEEWKRTTSGQKGWSGSFNAYYDAANAGKFYDQVNQDTSRDMYFYPQKDVMTKYFYGDSWFEFELSVPIDGNVDLSATADGDGQVFTSGF